MPGPAPPHTTQTKPKHAPQSELVSAENTGDPAMDGVKSQGIQAALLLSLTFSKLRQMVTVAGHFCLCACGLESGIRPDCGLGHPMTEPVLTPASKGASAALKAYATSSAFLSQCVKCPYRGSEYCRGLSRAHIPQSERRRTGRPTQESEPSLTTAV